MPDINEQIQEAFDLTKKDGNRRKLRFAKDEFFNENPDAATNPISALVSHGGIVRLEFEKNVTLSAGELRKLCADNPNHPLASQKRLSVSHLADEHEICVCKEDLESLKSGKAIIDPTEAPGYNT